MNLSTIPIRTGQTEIRLLARRLSNALVTLLTIAYLTSWGLILAERGRAHQPARPLEAAWEAVVRTAQYIFAHPQEYFWKKETHPAFSLVAETLQASAVLLLLALGVALLVGFLLGLIAALRRQKAAAIFIMLLSVLGTSTPSFLFAMLLWVGNIWLHRGLGWRALPSAGFGWDAHLVMPVLVLAVRPLAQIAQVTYMTIRDALQQDYIRTAHSKGLSWRLIRDAHVLPNILIPTLTTIGTSLRFSLASLPVVELFFEWPGVGLTLLQAIEQGNSMFVTDLLLSLGLFFLFVNLSIEILFPLIDARLQTGAGEEQREDQQTFWNWLCAIVAGLTIWLKDMRHRFIHRNRSLPPLPEGLSLLKVERENPAAARRKWLMGSLTSNPALLVGGLLLIGLLMIAFFGEKMTTANPYKVNGVMIIDGVIGAPPYAPSETFPWGTDYIGRDLQALVFAGGKRTLLLAFFAMLARLGLGTLLGALAGWQRGGWLDRLITGAIGVWAAFPVTLFAILVIQALGIQQGIWVFVVALSLVGWGEVAQFVRSQVITLKPQLFVEAARSAGSRSDQILVRHILPNLVNALIVLAALEMGGVMMLLAELGYLDIYMGGGFRAAIADMGRSMLVVHFSDVPEWAALIANIRNWWRSYPWMALYPGMAFFLAIITFNLFGEGLRRFLEDIHANLSRLFNRYTLMATLGAFVAIAFLLQNVSPLSTYRTESLRFDEQRVLQDICMLSSTEFAGRESGTPGADAAARYIARRMEEIGLLPGGRGTNYIEEQVKPGLHLLETPRLQVLNPDGGVLDDFVYRADFVEVPGHLQYGTFQGRLVTLSFGLPKESADADAYGVHNLVKRDNIVLIEKSDLNKISLGMVGGLLIIASNPTDLMVRQLYPSDVPVFNTRTTPVMYISPAAADRLLRHAGASLDEMRTTSVSLDPGQAIGRDTGLDLAMTVDVRPPEDLSAEKSHYVLGVIPGADSESGQDLHVIVVSAYYDGLGVGPDGTIYPGANDNASGVATMLELARLLKQSPYQPDKTIIFVAWPAGERGEGLSVTTIMNLRTGFEHLEVEAVIELSGVAAGNGKEIAVGEDSSYRLVRLFQSAAGKLNVATTTRGRGPHYGRDIPPAFGGRKSMTLSISWNGADDLAHTPLDTCERIDPQKLRTVGRTVYLTLLVLGRETEY